MVVLEPRDADRVTPGGDGRRHRAHAPGGGVERPDEGAMFDIHPPHPLAVVPMGTSLVIVESPAKARNIGLPR